MGDPLVLLLGQLFEFLSRYSWVYKFRWIDPNYTQLASTVHHPFLSYLPTEWKDSFAICTFGDLKALVAGDHQGDLWPPDLLSFANECRKFTRLLSEFTRLPPEKRKEMETVCLVSSKSTRSANFLKEQVGVQLGGVGMTPKKLHEVTRMTHLTEYLLLGTKLSTKRNMSLANHSNESLRSPQVEAPCYFTDDDASVSATLSRLQFLVDIGSGLGHLPNSVARRCIPPVSSTCIDNFSHAPIHVIAVESDASLHHKAEQRLRVDRPRRSAFHHSIDHCVHRLLFHLEPDNIVRFKTELNVLIQNTHCETSTPADFGAYVISGLHCCGNLSYAILRLFRTDPAAQRLILVGCCYHKMTLNEFPISAVMRLSMDSAFLDQFLTIATFRLACQWSPDIWLHWTDHDFNGHRMRFIYRLMQSICCPAQYTSGSKHGRRFDPTSSAEIITILDAGCAASFEQIYDALFQCLVRRCACSTWSNVPSSVINELHQLWLITPGLLAIQQLIQPLLELLILLDRLLYIREESNLKFSGLVRLFDPLLSPRCLALVACK